MDEEQIPATALMNNNHLLRLLMNDPAVKVLRLRGNHRPVLLVENPRIELQPCNGLSGRFTAMLYHEIHTSKNFFWYTLQTINAHLHNPALPFSLWGLILIEASLDYTLTTFT